jgi:alginate O-acetyltransferase complex protein AlgI
MAFVPIYILILGFTIVIDYFAGIIIENAEGKRRRFFLICSLIANIAVLAVFKYYNFLNHNFSFLMHGFGLTNPIPYLEILLPIGLSFHTFQAMSYTIEVYRRKQKAERHFGIYSLYVMFYPQLVAGPIERPQNLLHQFREKYDFDYDRVTSGLRLMSWGLLLQID